MDKVKKTNRLLEAYLKKSGFKFRNKNTLKNSIVNVGNSFVKPSNEHGEIQSNQSYVIPEPR